MYLSPANPSLPFYAPPYPYAPLYPSNPSSALPMPLQADPSACGQNFLNVFQSSYHQPHIPVPLESSSVSRTALSDATISMVNGSDSTRSTSKRKHPSASGGPGSKRPRTTSEDTSGIPESEAAPPTASSSYGSLLDSGLSTSHAAATHIWHFVRGVHSRNRPESALPPEKSASIRPKERDFPSLCCKLTGVKELSKPPTHLSILMPSPLPASLVGISEDEYRRQYTLALELDIVGRVRKLVTAVRASGQRREAFMQIIREGNTSGGFGDPPERLRLVGLLKDMEVRWSSLFKMIDRFLQQYPACAKFIKSVSADFSFEHEFSPVEVQVLLDIREFLLIFHVVQEVVSGERTPTLAFVLPLYEELVTMLRDFATAKPQLAHAVDIAITKLIEYLDHSRKNPVYAVAIVLNPTTKFEWLKDHWSEVDYAQARKNVTNMLLDGQRKRRQEQGSSPTSATTSQLPTPARQTVNTHMMSDEARNLGSGMTRLQALKMKLSQSLSQSSDPESQSSPSPSMSNADDLRAIEEGNQKVVDDEIVAYERAGCLAGEDLADFDLLRFWQEHQHDFPLFYRVALDVLPIQASAVPCERVFSSSKETDALRRSSMGDDMMEQLQILKFRFRSDRLSFTDDLVCSDEELSVIDLDVDVIEDLIATGRVTELHEYIIESWKTWGSTDSAAVGWVQLESS